MLKCFQDIFIEYVGLPVVDQVESKLTHYRHTEAFNLRVEVEFALLIVG